MKVSSGLLGMQMSTRSSILRKVRTVLVVVGPALLWGATATAQQDSATIQYRIGGSLQHRKAKLEIQKLGLEINKLSDELAVARRNEQSSQQKLGLEVKKLDEDFWFRNKWGPSVVVVVVGILSVIGSLLVARWARFATLDQATHTKRLESYPELVAATSPLAIYFPDLGFSESLEPRKCGAIGRALSKWYFTSGLLLSTEARDAYFRLARALTLASRAEKELYVPFPNDAKEISRKSIHDYRERLGIGEPDDAAIENWKFGIPQVGEKTLDEEMQKKFEYKFKDYVFLQTLSSRLRTVLSEDISSRRLPEGRSSSRRFAFWKSVSRRIAFWKRAPSPEEIRTSRSA
jgi:hypothetical protein